MISRFAPGLGDTFGTFEPIGLTEAGRMVAIYTPSVSQTASAVYVLTLDHSKGRFASLRSACVIGRRVIAEYLPYRGRRIEAACVEARQQARLRCAVTFPLGEMDICEVAQAPAI